MSIRLRLALWYGGLTGLVVALVCLCGYAIHSRAHYDDVDSALAGAVEHLAEEYVARTTAQERAAMFAVPVAPDMVTRALNASGEVLAATPNAAAAHSSDPRVVLAGPDVAPYDAVARLAPPTIARPPTGAGVFGLTADAEGRRWRLYVLPVHDATQYLLGAVPLDRIDASIAGFRRLMA